MTDGVVSGRGGARPRRVRRLQGEPGRQRGGAGALAAPAGEPVAATDDADVCVLMTCCVTAEAERKSRRLARRLARDGRRVLVAGCAATLRAAQFAHPGVEVVAGGWEAVAQRLGRAAGRAGRSAAPAGHSGRRDAARRRPGVVRARASPSRSRTAAPAAAATASCASCAGGRGACRSRRPWRPPARPPCSGAAARSCSAASTWAPTTARATASTAARRAAAPPRRSRPRPRRTARPRPPAPLVARARAVDDRLLDALAHPRRGPPPARAAAVGRRRRAGAMGRRYDWQVPCQARATRAGPAGDVMLEHRRHRGFPAGGRGGLRAHARRAARATCSGACTCSPTRRGRGRRPRACGRLPAPVVKARAAAAGEAAAAAQRRAAARAVGRPAEVLVEDRRDGLWRGYSSQYVRYHLRGEARPGALVARRRAGAARRRRPGASRDDPYVKGRS